MLIIDVPDVDEVARKVEEAGGVLLNAKERVGDFGFSQYVKDSEGTVLCLWESIGLTVRPDRRSRSDGASGKPGDRSTIRARR